MQGGDPLFGIGDQSETAGGGAWVARMDSVRLNTDDKTRTWEALRLGWSLGDRRVVVPYCAGHLVARWARQGFHAAFSDGATFSDGTLFVSGPGMGLLAEPVALRATTAKILLPLGAGLVGGEPFTLVGPTAGERKYGVARVLDIDTDLNLYTVLFAKPARELYEAGAEVDFHDPRCLMLAQMGDGAGAPTYGGSWSTTASMTFVEAPPP